jgi:hypothetical protein
MPPTKSLNLEVDKIISAQIEDWMEARENERYKWGEPAQPELDFDAIEKQIDEDEDRANDYD